MALIPAAIHQFSPGCDVGDGITNGLFFTQKILHSLGVRSEIFSIHIPDALQGVIQDYRNYRSQPDQVLLVHHSLGTADWDWVGQQTAVKILIYHNITPAEFFPEGSFLYEHCVLGRRQLADSVSWFGGAIGDSAYNSAELIDCGYAPVVTIPLLIDLEKNLTAPWDPGVVQQHQHTFNLLFIGRIIENKQQHELIELFAQFKQLYRRPAKLLLVGGTMSIDYENRLRALIRDRQLHNEVELTGKVSSEQLYGYYRAADVFVCLSEHEGFGMPLIEAMCFDVPVVALDTSNIGNTLGASGILFTEKRLPEMAACLKLLAEHREFRRRIKRSQRCNLQRFTLDTVRAQLVEFLNHLDIAVALPANVAMASPRPQAREGLGVREGHSPVQYQIEGPFDSSYSLALVNRELALALQPEHSVALYSTEGPGDFPPNPAFLNAHPEVATLWRNSDNPWLPETVVRNLYPPRVADARGLTTALGVYGWEESTFPVAWMDDFNQRLDLVATMSDYVTKTLIDNGLRRPCATVGIGVDHFLAVKPEPLPVPLKAGFRFLHNSSAFPRKGVDVLLAAWVQAFTARDPVALIIKTFPNPHNTVKEQLARLAIDCPNHAPIQLINEDLSPSALVSLYQECQALVAPSRGEGFGLPMAEAMLFDLPVIVTGHGGQTDFCTDETAWLIDYQFARAQTHMNLYDSVWAEPSVDHLATLLRQVFQAPAEALRQRATVAKQRLLSRFTWRAVAERLESAVQALDQQPLFDVSSRLAWISTWNTKCGIATYSNYLVSQLDPGQVFVLANRTTELTQPDKSNVLRCWNSGWEDPLEDLGSLIQGLSISSVVIQFNCNFFKLEFMAALIEKLHRRGAKIFLFFHSTADVPHPGFTLSLKTIARALRQADRILVHSLADLNRLKDFGLVNNVTLFPHGVSLPESFQPPVAKWGLEPVVGHRRIIASYGFLLPHKGIPQLIEAFSRLQPEFGNLHLLLVNACYPVAESSEEQQRCQRLVQQLGIASRVTMINDFLPAEEFLSLLNLAELIVFPYQHTQESASGAVRQGLAANRPVICSPLNIFDDVADAVQFLPGVTVNDIQQGIKDFLNAPDRVAAQVQRQTQWLQGHHWALLAQRLWNMVIGIKANA
jgi:glycosyltransferase involved in cell wall biosynthesis